MGRGACQNLHDLSVLKGLVEGYDGAVGLCTRAVGSHLRVDFEGKVQGGGSHRKLDDPALGSEDHDRVLKELVLDLVHVILILLDFLGPVLDLRDDLVVVDAVVVLPGSHLTAGGCLVRPVGGNSLLGGLVHLLGSDLDLQMLAVRSEDGGVEGLVVVGLRHCDVILEPALDRVPGLMDDAEDGVTFSDALTDYPHSEDVEDLVDLLLPAFYLKVNGVDVLDPAFYLNAGDADLGTGLCKVVLNLLEICVVLALLGKQEVVYVLVCVRLQRL